MNTPTSTRAGRAAPMSPEERRASILAATVPLLLERGRDVTTRELAAAAGVAEGTLFRVFADKQELVRAAVAQVLDPAELLVELAELAAAAGSSTLHAVLVRAVTVLQVRGQRITSIFVVAHQVLAAEPGRPGGAPTGAPHGHGHGHDRPHPMDLIADAMAEVFAPHAAEVRRSPQECARFLTAIVMATIRPGVPSSAVPLTPEEVVDLLLDGLRVRTEEN
ncbi:MAG TPA: helix-turn-helix domain-containing protein [Cellulomonas sp.]